MNFRDNITKAISQRAGAINYGETAAIYRRGRSRVRDPQKTRQTVIHCRDAPLARKSDLGAI
jgi:hypothetical protein